MKQWFTADLHFGHPLVAATRGFTATEQHDATIADNWIKNVAPQDTVYVLGDIVGRTEHTNYALGLIGSLPGTKHLIAGNHDQVSSIHRDGWKHQARWLQVFTSVQSFAHIRCQKNIILLSHFPYEGDHTESDRFSQYRLRDEGQWLLHGHTHSQQKNAGRQMHVGLDAWGLHLVPQETIADLVATTNS